MNTAIFTRMGQTVDGTVTIDRERKYVENNVCGAMFVWLFDR